MERSRRSLRRCPTGTWISVVDVDSLWVDAYFEETYLGPIQKGDPATIKLMGYHQLLCGHVESIAHAIDIPNGEGLARVNPIFTWVRLAQRIPVRIHIGCVPRAPRWRDDGHGAN
jgi:multidrug resistance efflux pump